MVHPVRLGGPSRDLPRDRWPTRATPTEREDVRPDAHPYDRPQERNGSHRDPRLLRGRPAPVHARDERLGRARAGVVAQPAGASRRLHRPARWFAHDPCPRRDRRRANPPVGRDAAPRAEPRRLRISPRPGNGACRVRATGPGLIATSTDVRARSGRGSGIHEPWLPRLDDPRPRRLASSASGAERGGGLLQGCLVDGQTFDGPAMHFATPLLRWSFDGLTGSPYAAALATPA